MKTASCASAMLFACVMGCSPDGKVGDPRGQDVTSDQPGDMLPDAPDGPMPVPYFFPMLSNGTHPGSNDVFRTREDVYLNAVSGDEPRDGNAGLIPLEGPPVEPTDYYFDVTLQGGITAGQLASTDDQECRRIHIDSAGNIDHVYPGPAGCEHPFIVDPKPYQKGGKLLVQLAPYLPSPVAGTNVEMWCLHMRRVDGGLQDTNGRCFFVAICGDGFSWPDIEHCDDGNLVDGDGCSSTCDVEAAPVCGDGVKEANEACDDGNTSSQDGCNAQCEIEHLCCCGNGHVEPGEQCDDGNGHDGDGCSAGCQSE